MQYHAFVYHLSIGLIYFLEDLEIFVVISNEITPAVSVSFLETLFIRNTSQSNC